MNATFTKTILAALALGTSLLAAPAFAGDRHYQRCEGAIVDTENFGNNNLYVDSAGCAENTIRQERNGNRTSVTSRDDARLFIRDLGGSDTDFYAEGRGQIASETYRGRTSASVSQDARASIKNYGGVTNVQGSGRSDTIVRNRGGIANVRNFGSGTTTVTIR